MEAAFKKVVQERSALTEENRNLFEKLQQSNSLFQESERTWRTELQDACDELRQAKRDTEKLHKKYDALKVKYSTCNSDLRDVKAEINGVVKEQELLQRQLREKEDIILRFDRDKKAEDSMASIMLSKAERELDYKEEMIAGLRQELQTLKTSIHQEHVSKKEFDRLSAAFDKLTLHVQNNTVPAEQYSNLLNDVSRLQDSLTDSVPRRDFLSMQHENSELRDKQYSAYVPKEKFEALQAEFLEYRSRVNADHVTVTKHQEVVARLRQFQRVVEQEYVELACYDKLQAQLEAALNDRRLVEESARVLEEERDQSLKKLSEKCRELATLEARLLQVQREYSALSSLVPESNGVIESLQGEVQHLQGELRRFSAKVSALETEKAGMLIHLGNAKLKAKHGSDNKSTLQRLLEESKVENGRLLQLLESAQRKQADADDKYKVLEGVVAEYKHILAARSAQQKVIDITQPQLTAAHRQPVTPPMEQSSLFLGRTVPVSPLRPQYLTQESAATPSTVPLLTDEAASNSKRTFRSPRFRSLDERLREFQASLSPGAANQDYTAI